MGCWAAFEDTLFPDRLCDGRAELGVWYSGSVVNDRTAVLFEKFLPWRLVGCWAAFEDTLFPDRLCGGRAELGVWHIGSVVKD